MTCVNPANQPIYQALLDKAASYPPDKVYQALAYKKAAQGVLNYRRDIYHDITEYNCHYGIQHVGVSIYKFIKEFIKTEVFPSDNHSFATKAMEDAHRAAVANAPKDITTWPNDDEARAAFLEKVNASKEIQELEEKNERMANRAAQRAKRREERANQQTFTPLHFYYQDLQNQKPVVYTKENPRRSTRLVNKPKVIYFTKEDEQMEFDELIQNYCNKTGFTFSYDLVNDFNMWLSNAPEYQKAKWCHITNKYIPLNNSMLLRKWAQYSPSIKQIIKLRKIHHSLVCYCKKHTIQYDPIMDEKFYTWLNDPSNDRIVKRYYTYDNYSFFIMRPNGYCINKWFSTLKKNIIW